MGNLKILYCALGWQNPLPFYILANYRNKNYSSRRVFTSKILLLFLLVFLLFTSRFYIELINNLFNAAAPPCGALVPSLKERRGDRFERS